MLSGQWLQYPGLCEHSVSLMSAAEEKGAEDGASLPHRHIFVPVFMPTYSWSAICVFMNVQRLEHTFCSEVLKREKITKRLEHISLFLFVFIKHCSVHHSLLHFHYVVWDIVKVVLAGRWRLSYKGTADRNISNGCMPHYGCIQWHTFLWSRHINILRFLDAVKRLPQR